LQPARLVTFADDELRAAAAYVDNKRRPGASVDMLRNAEVDQTRLFHARNDFDGMPQGRFGGNEESLHVTRAAQSAGADDPHLVRLHVAQPLAKAPQTLQRAFLAFVIEVAVFAEARCQTHHLA